MGIYVNAELRGARGGITRAALVDTGAELSLMPSDLDDSIGAWRTYHQVSVVSIHGETRILPVICAQLNFTALNNIGGRFAFAMCDAVQELIIGMDILRLLGVSIDTKTHRLSVRNEVWEAFKTFAAAGVIFYAGMKILE